MGDNGAGKSTLIKILSGSVSLDSGVIRFQGEPVEIRRPSDAVNIGIQTVYQDLALCGNLDIIDNIFLGREPRGGFLQGWRVKRPEMERVGREILDSMAIRITHIDVPVDALSGGQRQCAAVCRAVLGDPKVVVLDEPTAALGVTQTQDVLTLIGAPEGAGARRHRYFTQYRRSAESGRPHRGPSTGRNHRRPGHGGVDRAFARVRDHRRRSLSGHDE